MRVHQASAPASTEATVDPLGGVRLAIRRYRRAERRRDAAHDELLAAIRAVAASDPSATCRRRIAEICGYSSTWVRHVIERPVSRRDPAYRDWVPPLRPHAGLPHRTPPYVELDRSD